HLTGLSPCSLQVKSEGPKLVPFFKATCVYLCCGFPTSSPSWFSALIKCLPIFCLWVFLIFAGLIFSALGDAFLIWQEQGYFVHDLLTVGIRGFSQESAQAGKAENEE
uniref:lysoplasmalogenase n=1 Tax=Xenopus tropicalis TaxID=8364 RepID=A0A803KBY3_XENTR